VRAVAQAALARADPETFLTVLSGLDVDPDWTVRAALATTLGGLGKDAATPRLGQLAGDTDARVRAPALTALARVGAAGAEKVLTAELQHTDPVVRMAAARGLGTLKAAGAVPALSKALEASRADTTYVARAAILGALAGLDPATATPLLRTALADTDWAVRVRAAALLRELDAKAAAAPQRPAPAPVEPALDATTALVSPAYTPQAYIETSKGEIRFDLAVLDAPRTVANFTALAGKGFFDGLTWHRIVPDFVVQTGDPRGDGEGGPGYSVRDELSMRPYLRGTVGMALDWEDTGGSQFFITHSPQPHLDARYPVLGQVAVGMDVVDRLEPGDRIVSVRVWDGVRWIGRAQ
jgi:cyclophilin family peptidyl-prolyl cis-trans isomerase